MHRSLKIGVIGGTSITGGEVCRFLLNHPSVKLILPTARGEEIFERIHPSLKGSGLKFHKLEQLFEKDSIPDVVFFCTPAGEAMKYAEKFLAQNTKVIDLSADFRFRNAEEYENAYDKKHLAPKLLEKAVCGITEIYSDKLYQSEIVANPGCYVIASVLGLLPIINADFTDLSNRINISAINGTSGAGAKLRKELHHPFAFGTILPYNLDGHRHRIEIERRLEEVSNRKVLVDLTTMHGNFARGIITIASIPVSSKFINQDISRNSLLAMYKSFFSESSLNNWDFVKLIDCPPQNTEKNSKEYDIYPNLARVVGSNFCHIGLDYDSETNVIKVVSVIDNLVKGAAGSAIQNMNVMLGIEQSLGIKTFGI